MAENGKRVGPAAKHFCEKQGWLLLIIICIAVGLRAWGLDYGLPYIYHPDESLVVIKGLYMLKSGDLNPRFFHWPSLVFYLNTLVYGAYFIVGKLLGVFVTPADLPYPIMLGMGTGYTVMPSMWLMNRVLTMSMGVGTVLLAFLSGRKLSGKTAVGLVAAFLTAISPNNVAMSRNITPDAFTSFFVMLSFYGSVLIYRDDKLRYYLLTGLAIGLAVSTKYNGALVALPFIVAYYSRHGLRGIKNGRLYLTAGLSLIAFLATTPYALLDYKTFLTDLQFDALHYSTGHAGMEGDTLRWYLTYLWRIEGIGFILAVFGIIWGLYHRSRDVVLLAIFPLVYFVMISNLTVRNDRTLLPMLPFLSLSAAFFFHFLFNARDRLGAGQRKWMTLVGCSLALIAAAIPLRNTINGGVRLTTVDSRETSRTWIAENLPPGSRIAFESYAPYMDPGQFSLQAFNGLKDQSLDWYADNGFDYLVFSQGAYKRFYNDPDRYKDSIASYDALFEGLDEVKIFHDGGYEVRIYAVPK